MSYLPYVAFWLAVAIGLVSCSMSDMQRHQLVADAQAKCFDAPNGQWDAFNGVCVKKP